jgi:hypothetical protein
MVQVLRNGQQLELLRSGRPGQLRKQLEQLLQR